MQKNEVIWALTDGHDASITQFDLTTGDSKTVELEKYTGVKHDFFVREQKYPGEFATGFFRDLIRHHGWTPPTYFVHSFVEGRAKPFRTGDHYTASMHAIGALKFPIKSFEIVTPDHTPHHLAHALSGYHTSPFKNAFVLSIDGLGDSAYITKSTFRDGILQDWEVLGGVDEHNNGHAGFCSIHNCLGYFLSGLISPNVTGTELGTKWTAIQLDFAGKMMGLSSYSPPDRKLVNHYKDLMWNKPRLDQWLLGRIEGSSQFNPFREYEKYVGASFWNWRGGVPGEPFPPRKVIFEKDEEILQCASLQAASNEFLHELVKQYASTIKKHDNNIVLVGGGTQNVVANTYLRENTEYNIYVPPDPGDSGLSYGIAVSKALSLGWKPLHPSERPHRRFSGLKFIDHKRDKLFDKVRTTTVDEVAQILKDGKIIGLIQGTCENGPRALGNRSVLCDPSYADMRDKINANIKNREWYRPFAPVCRAEDCEKFFDARDFKNMEHMSMICTVKEEYKDAFPSIRHVDNTARLQVCTEESNPLLYKILDVNKSVLLNTSFNVQGKPIVNDWETAYGILRETDLDYILYDDDGILLLYA